MISKSTESFDKPVHILKFGGSSLATPEQVIQSAKTIQQVHSSGKHVVAVVSAMGTITNELNALAKQVSKKPKPSRVGYACEHRGAREYGAHFNGAKRFGM